MGDQALWAWHDAAGAVGAEQWVDQHVALVHVYLDDVVGVVARGPQVVAAADPYPRVVPPPLPTPVLEPEPEWCGVRSSGDDSDCESLPDLVSSSVYTDTDSDSDADSWDTSGPLLEPEPGLCERVACGTDSDCESIPDLLPPSDTNSDTDVLGLPLELGAHLGVGAARDLLQQWAALRSSVSQEYADDVD